MALAYDKLVLFGDSITQYAYDQANGFALGSALQNDYTRKLDVIQRGYGGYNSDEALLMIDKIIKYETTDYSQIKLLVIFFGTNDAATPPSVQHVPIGRYRDNLRNIIKTATDAGIKVVLIGPGPYNFHQWRLTHTDEVSNQRSTIITREYTDAASEVAAETGVPFVPLWYLIMEKLGWKKGDLEYGLKEGDAKNPLSSYLTDGIHYAGPAYEVEYLGILDAIKKAYPELLPENLPLKLPTWQTIDNLEEFAKLL
ncbi:SGNH hydrolase-type esterase domain-containing protein [Lipomyces japonicus]|uniref:SGNH hydrolase-type esterase domain-containing protein n=1 Tax=Lipomyces japonicus TaxID=56871 RepID=UPI0034CE55E4